MVAGLLAAVAAVAFGWVGAIIVWAGAADTCLFDGAEPGDCGMTHVERTLTVAWGLCVVGAALCLGYAAALAVRWAVTLKPARWAGRVAVLGTALVVVWFLPWIPGL